MLQGQPVAVLSYEHWKAAYASDPNVMGRSIPIDGVARTVVGVMPPGVDVPSGVAAWIPRP